jgi:hypothetical protein
MGYAEVGAVFIYAVEGGRMTDKYNFVGVDTGKRDNRHITDSLPSEIAAFHASGKQATQVPIGVSGNKFKGYRAAQRARLKNG